MAPPVKTTPTIAPGKITVQGSKDPVVINFDQLKDLVVMAGTVQYKIRVQGMALSLVRKEI